VLLAAALPAAAAFLAAPVWRRSHLLYTLSVAMGAVVGGMILLRGANTKITRETNYYTIKVTGEDSWGRMYRTLVLDHLIHSIVELNDPTFIHYKHEYIQIELLQAAAAVHPEEQRVLVIGGGGYTFPRYARTMIPTSKVDVVEIDPGVTAVAYTELGLDPKLGVVTYNLDGRQFVAERAPAGHYHVISLDAVNDLAVPWHLLTKQFNEGVKRALAPDGVYLLTVIDMLEDGKLWRAAVHTLKETFPHVEVLSAYPNYRAKDRQVYVIYAASRPLDLDTVRKVVAPPDAALAAAAGPAAYTIEPLYTRRLPVGEPERLLALDKPIILTDQYAPTDNLMAEVFRRREKW
jgi:spermidine synthase